MKARDSAKIKAARDEMKKFGYEDLGVWDRAVDFTVKVIELAETIDTGGNTTGFLNKLKQAQPAYQ